MPSIEINGVSVETDGEGYLANSADWNRDIGLRIAKSERVEMTEAHWEVLNILREHYEEYKILPAIRMLTKAMGRKLGMEKGNTKFLYQLFPAGTARQACKIAGLPKPTGCV